jgi:hypothetical protein
MERREHYDPEDIERLLQERGFDELLAEERAYVLRHLSGRGEYEAMRALLQQVRDDDQARPIVQADDDVRTHVMRAYRQQHEPRWRIWLNSLGGLLLPQPGAAMPLLRPALAVASLALLITAGVWVARMAIGGEADQPLAELKAQPTSKQEAAGGAAERVPEPLVQPQAAEATISKGARPEAAQGATAAPEQKAIAQELAKTDATETMGLHAPVADAANAQVTDAEAGARSEADEQTQPARTRAATASHVVTEAELMQNYSLANATGKVSRAKKAEESTTMGTLADSPALLGLMAAGW